MESKWATVPFLLNARAVLAQSENTLRLACFLIPEYNYYLAAEQIPLLKNGPVKILLIVVAKRGGF